jgi:signal transduction histidine kinase
MLEDLAYAASQVVRAGNAEEALQRSHDELERRVEQRTLRLTRTVKRLHKEVVRHNRAKKALHREWLTLEHLLRSSDHERQLIAYEIHDGLAQQLAGAIIQFQIFDSHRERSAHTADKAYAEGITLLKRSLAEARRIISGVRPPILDESGVVAAILHLVHDCHETARNVQIDFHRSLRVERLDPTLENVIYRIVQEGLTNALRYGRSKTIRVELTQTDRLQIVIQDWGVGFSPADVPRGCYGLEGIRERARLLGGTATIESATGKGTRIEVDLPLITRTTVA